MERVERGCRRFFTFGAMLLIGMVICSGLQPAVASPLEIVPPTNPFEVTLTRGQAETILVEIRNITDNPVPLGILKFAFGGTKPDDTPIAPQPRLIYANGCALSKGQITTIGLVFPPYNAMGVYSGEVYMTGAEPTDQTMRILTFPIKVQEREGTTLSRAVAGWSALALSAMVLFLPFVFVFDRKKEAGKRRNFFQSPPDEVSGEPARYSVSRFQVWLWSAAILFAFTFIFLTRGPNIYIPPTVVGLMAISVGSITTATGIAVLGGDKKPAASQDAVREKDQNWLASMLSEKGEPSAMRLQMFAWTVALVLFFVWRAITTATLWEIDPSLLSFMGISHAGYLIDKTVAKGKDPQPTGGSNQPSAPGSGTPTGNPQDASPRKP